ncbi:amidohydrolase family protein [Cryobacterium sp. SO1]|uniref:amidohydrolase family protein n=1 Tax=Cryobacterium sp. SO1 TaxID=1897061 RepID=UPI001023F38C|nr:amidohydrolase [Cryobacterium sp. SO1]RZI36256.1 5-methylthioadenosine/S-adenosylhomocysteine deaminase [Cryobacterium sp. SO1]
MAAEPVDLILTADAVLTVDAAGTVVEAGAVAIRAGVIVGVGPAVDLLARFVAGEVLESPGCVIAPGWVNTHTHLAMNLFRGAADDVTLEVFLERMIGAEMRTLSAETVSIGARAGIAECLAGGTTTALDMYWFPRASRAVAAKAGFRLLNGPIFMGNQDPEGRDFAGMLAEARAILADNRAETPDEDLWVMPHSAYLLDRGQLESIRALADDVGARVHTHASESHGEVAMATQVNGDRPVAVLDQAGLLTAQTVLAHAVHLTDGEIHRIAASGAAVAHCPISNLKLGCGIARVPELLAADAAVALGTDGAASAGALDMFAAVRMAALLHKGTTNDPTMISAERAVRLGTVDGARAVGLADVGTIEAGMQADLQVVRVATLNAQPTRDPWSALVYAATATDVRHTVARGRIVLRDRVLQTIDEDTALRELSEAAAR